VEKLVHARRNVFIIASDSFCKHFSGAASTQSQNSLAITANIRGFAGEINIRRGE
jgi:hypothetical protein